MKAANVSMAMWRQWHQAISTSKKWRCSVKGNGMALESNSWRSGMAAMAWPQRSQ